MISSSWFFNRHFWTSYGLPIEKILLGREQWSMMNHGDVPLSTCRLEIWRVVFGDSISVSSADCSPVRLHRRFHFCYVIGRGSGRTTMLATDAMSTIINRFILHLLGSIWHKCNDARLKAKPVWAKKLFYNFNSLTRNLLPLKVSLVAREHFDDTYYRVANRV